MRVDLLKPLEFSGRSSPPGLPTEQSYANKIPDVMYHEAVTAKHSTKRMSETDPTTSPQRQTEQRPNSDNDDHPGFC